MATSPAHLQCWFHPVLTQVILEFQQGLHGEGAAIREQPLVILDDQLGCRDCRFH
jgi:hypothetical protein